jgi:hypothetical protein
VVDREQAPDHVVDDTLECSEVVGHQQREYLHFVAEVVRVLPPYRSPRRPGCRPPQRVIDDQGDPPVLARRESLQPFEFVFQRPLRIPEPRVHGLAKSVHDVPPFSPLSVPDFFPRRLHHAAECVQDAVAAGVDWPFHDETLDEIEQAPVCI